MAWLFVLAVVLTFAALGFAATVILLVTRDRLRRRRADVARTSRLPDPVAQEAAELSQAADSIQLWLDDQWHQKFGRGLTDSSDTVDG